MVNINPQRLVDLFNKIHQFDTWCFATMGDDPIVVSDGDMHEGVEFILRALRLDLKLRVIVSQDAVAIAKEKASILERYQREVESYVAEQKE